MKICKLALLLTTCAIAFPAQAQDQAPQTTETAEAESSSAIIVTGSRIKRDRITVRFR
jgi:hypothetical protein